MNLATFNNEPAPSHRKTGLPPSKSRVKIRQNSLLAKIACLCLRRKDVALTLFKTIYLSRSTPSTFLKNKRWVAHELAHIRQFATHGNLKFIAMYLAESLRKGYYDNKWEIEARLEELNPDIIQLYNFEYKE